MPSYTYKCNVHGDKEVDKPMSESTKEENCPDCGQPMTRVFGATQTIWKCDGAFGKSK